MPIRTEKYQKLKKKSGKKTWDGPAAPARPRSDGGWEGDRELAMPSEKERYDRRAAGKP